ncbi:hypothetical protein HK103_005349 [Boothiomyces macroporosus]|uniref:Fe2OG dioxygenase domain-containing protein n=1 Tax=Boothiomyces macroporosus TaxID=261099 RepID=A0AAD5ULK9_9FUNG|nr:hypothetical protein HK103_005349 [Boothiomyces macroporosus]
MGKLAKQKKRKLQQLELNENEIQEISNEDLDTTIKTLAVLAKNEELLQDKRFKQIRVYMHQLSNGKGQTASGKVSDALRDGRWRDAIHSLDEMRARGQVPKLGALQRWTRDCDAAGYDDNFAPPEVYLALDAILRTADPKLVLAANPGKQPSHPLRKHQPWSPPDKIGHWDPTEAPNLDPAAVKSKFKVIYKESGPDRKPPNLHPMTLYLSEPGAVDMTQHNYTVKRFDVPYLPGAFVLQSVLSPFECNTIIEMAQIMGFTPDTPAGGSAKDLKSVLAHNFFWLADEELNNTIYNRCKHLLPQVIGGDVAGLNARWRVYRYTPGSIYRPHIDGAWPGSGVNKDGKYEYDNYGDRWSKLTFLIRLNDDFKGGATTFFTPSVDVGYLDARPILPKMGDVLVFPHGDTEGSMLHEGSAVMDTLGLLRDAKYVIRTEVLYKIPHHVRK